MPKRLLISGLVQGVYFRESMRAAAERLGVDGWVRNLDDGRVEALLSGPDALVDLLVAWAHAGPEAARVDSVELTASNEAVGAGFQVIR